jgi:chromosome segregation ATPase
MVDMLIKTPIDELARILNEKKKLTLGEAAKLLNTNEAQVENWVKILEESGYVELVYPALGEPQIILKSMEKKDLIKKEKELKNRKEDVEEKTKDFEKKIDVVEEKVELSSKEFSKLDNELKTKLKDLEKNLKNIDKLESKRKEIAKKADEIKNLSNSISGEVESIKSNITQMENRISEHIKTIEGHGTDIKNLDESKKVIENEIISLEKEMSLIKLLANKPVSVPLMSLKNIFAKHKERTEEISKKRKEMHEKALKIKNVVSEKKNNIQKKKFFKFLKR